MLGDVDGVVLSVGLSVESDVDGVAVLLEVSVESLAGVESLDGVSSPAFEMAAPPPTVLLELGLELVRIVDDVGGEPQSELCASAAGAWTAKTPNAMSATPKSPSAIAAPSAAGLRSSALTVHPRFTVPA